eukprot:515087_1
MATNVDCTQIYFNNDTIQHVKSSSVFLAFIQLSILVIFKLIGHYATFIIINSKQTTLFTINIWFLCQLLISCINNTSMIMHFRTFLLINIIFCAFMIYLKRIQSSKKFFVLMILSEIFWLITCNDISCIAAYIFIFEGVVIQRIMEEYFSIKWTDGHLLFFAICKLIFISWIGMSLSWIISIFEMFYFIVPFASLKYKHKWKLNYDQWFFVDGCSHISLFFILVVLF